ncbi:MAG: single-stranded DNA-binding protein [Propionicimonas sp.]|uniref:single-stranded DNA-binding protein n=1 Tax=Propionicimonas sp. TaxID=1955623 RepID=UPI002B20B949|nr:single-stranded DNA-binding protein [Propionicimonas sp.]MEA4944494.1 single-stranded DNA-binding protein [Propionicimonas sp.]MEA5053873.1 single-stranded DNA-binding protein [Propionicimonas sp.]MEA5117694.1 single-stranded DNA-binding protein [Propionicimonas sp.]
MEAQLWMTGRVGSDVDYRAQSGSPWATFRMACTPRVPRGEEWKDGQTTWVTVNCSNRLAQHVMYSLRKGDPVIVVGRLRTNRWIDANGVEHEQLQIRAGSVGHDLTTGTTSFHRRPREAAPDQAGSPAEGETTPREGWRESPDGPDDQESGFDEFGNEPDDQEAGEASAA